MPHEQPPTNILRLELLARVLDKINWYPSESVPLADKGAAGMIRLGKRFKRVSGILERAFKERDVAIFPKSPYSACVGCRLVLNGEVIDSCVPWGDSPTAEDVDKHMKGKPPTPPAQRAVVPSARVNQRSITRGKRSNSRGKASTT